MTAQSTQADEANAAEVGVGAVGYVDSIQARASG